MNASATVVLLDLVGGAALLLWGLRMVRTGVMRAYGSNLRRSLGASLSNRFLAFLSGLGVTALLQSSTATALLAGSFASRGLVTTAPALALMLGADVGTSLVAQLLSLDLHWLAPAFIIAGVVGFSTGERSRRRDLGRAVVGLGLMLLALRMIVGASQPLRDSAALQGMLSALSGEPLLALLIAALLTWMAHSSLAVVLLLMSLVDVGIVPVKLGFVLVLGANLGGAIAPFFATMGAPGPGRRVPLGNLLFKALGVLIALTLVGLVAPYVQLIETDPARQIVNFHTGFNLMLVVLFLFLTEPAARMTERLLPERPAETDPRKPRYLDQTAIETPAVAIGCAARETLRMADTIETMLKRTIEVLVDDDRKLVGEIEQMDDVVDSLHEAIKLYLTEITRESLNETDGRRCADIMMFTTNLEHVGDIIDKNLMEMAAKRIKNNLHFSVEGLAEIRQLHARVIENLRLAMTVFISGDVDSARRLLEEKTLFRELERRMSDSHLERLRQGKLESIETSPLHLDILRDFKRINSHITSVAYPILDMAGELRESRLKRNTA
jgi:phosphate:Na+ symporter